MLSSSVVSNTKHERPPTSKGKHWTITKWIDEKWDGDTFMSLEHIQFLEYIVMGIEICPTTQTKHLQTYIYYNKDRTFLTVTKDFGKCRICTTRGTPQQNRTYCIKDGNFYEFGEIPLENGLKGGQALQAKWDLTKQLAIEGKLDEIDSRIYVSHYSTLKKIRFDNRPVPPELNWKDKESPNLWITGKTGTGKSRHVRDKYPNAFIKPCNKWWDQYNDEKEVLIEDIGLSHLYLGDHLKIWADRYGFRAECKGSTCVLRPEVIAVTSNYSIRELWPSAEIHEPLERRFQEIVLVNKHIHSSLSKPPSKGAGSDRPLTI